MYRSLVYIMHNADLYRDNNYVQKKLAIDHIKKYGGKIIWKTGNNRIIDLGCGDGTVITELKKYLPKDVTVLGCDISEAMVQLANQFYGNEHTSFKVLDMAGDLLDGMEGSFSHVFSFFAINWVVDQESTFKNIYNLLEPGGECFLSILGFSPIFEVYRNLARSSKWNTWVYDIEKFKSPYHDSQDPETEIKVLMENIGFNNIYIVNDQIIYTIHNMETIRDTLIAICPFKIPDNMMNDFWEDYVQELRLLKGFGEGLKDIKFNCKILTVHGRKPRDA